MLCQKCGSRPATKTWAEGGIMDFIHGMSAQWCLHCVITEQLRFAREAAARIPELEAKLAKEDAK